MSKKHLIPLLKFGLAAVIIGWLLYNIDPAQLEQLSQREVQWGLLSAGFLCSFGAVCLTFVRWRMLVQAIGIEFSLPEAFRLGFLGFLLNFVSVGLVGGDLFKAVFIARQNPGRRTEAAATVLVDRVMGLYALLVVTSIAVLTYDFSAAGVAVQTICNSTLIATACGGVGIAILLAPGVTGPRIVGLVEKLPLVGPTLGRLLNAAAIYRSKPLVLTITAIMSLLVHTTIATGVFLSASAFFNSPPTWQEQAVIVPLSLVAGALPITPAGLGAFEAAMEQLYTLIPSTPRDGDGLIVALVFRLITIAIAAIGGIYYVIGRREVDAVLEEAEHVDEQPETPAEVATEPEPASVAPLDVAAADER